jgi:NIPSNAP
MFTCDTGGTLNRVIHLYHYNDFDQRDLARRAAANTPAWSSEFIPRSREYVAHQESSIYVPAVPVLEAAKSTPVQQIATTSSPPAPGTPPAMYELRQYQLHPGYGSVPKLIEAFRKG